MTQTDKHIINNFDKLAVNEQRRDALEILEAGIKAVDAEKALKDIISYQDNTLCVKGETFDLSKFEKILVIGIGKAAIQAAKTLEALLGDRINDGIVLDTRSGTFNRLKSLVGTHPLPSPQNVAATNKISELLDELTEKDLLISIISGGGSALLCQPYQTNCEDLAKISKLLMDKGASIQELNTVRKHMSEILGGQFAELAYPATIIGLIFSDIPNNDLSFVASGPTYKDTTTITDAAEILSRYNVVNVCNLPNCDLKETTKDEKYFKNVHNYAVVTNKKAAAAMLEKAQSLGYEAFIKTTELTGEARDVGRSLAEEIKPNQAIIATGETTVTVLGQGIGGRNQEVALGALQDIDGGSLVLSCNSDGIDNSPAAGAIADNVSKEKSDELNLLPDNFLSNNDAYTFFQKISSAINTGPTGINVSDLLLALGKRN